MHQTIKRIAASKLLWAAAVLLLLYSLGGFLLAPYLVGRYLPRYAQEHLEQRAAVGSVRINPFLLTLEVSDFQLEGTDGGPMLAVKRLRIDLKLSSLVRRAWTFDEVRFEGLDARLEIDRTGTLNLARLIERLRDPQAASAAPPRLVVEHLILSDSRIDLVDLSGETRASVSFTPVNLDLTDFSTLADGKGQYTLVADAAQGGSLAWKGSLSLQPLAATGVMRVQGIKLATVWQFLRDELGVAEPRGELVLADARYDFSYRNGTPLLGVSALQAQVSDLVVAPAASASSGLLSLRSIRVTGARFALADKTAVVAKLEVADGEVRASVMEDGTLDWQKRAPRANSGASPDPVQPPAGQPWRMRVERVGVEKVALTFADNSTKPGLAARVAALNGGLMLEVTAGAGAPQVIVGDVEMAVQEAVLATPVSGTPLATLDSFVLTGGGIDTHGRSLRAESITMSGGGLKIARNGEGPTGLLHALLSAAGPTVSDRPPAPPGARTGANAWRYRVGAVKLERFDVGLADLSFDPEIAYDIRVVSAALTQIDSMAKTPIAFKTELRMGERGSVSSSGTMQQDFGQARAKLEVRNIALTPLRPLVARYALVDLKSGNLTAASAQVDYGHNQSTPTLAVTGLQAQVSDLVLSPAASASALLALRSIQVSDARFALADRTADVAKLELADGEVRVSVLADGTLDWQKVAAQTSSAKPSGPTAPAAGQPWRMRVERVGVEKVALAYADHSTKPGRVVRAPALNGGLMLDVTAGAGAPQVIAKDIELAVAGMVVATPASGTTIAMADSFVLTGGGIDTRARSVVARSVAISGGSAIIERGRDGPTGLLRPFLSASAESAAATRASPGKQAAGASPWQYRVDAMKLERFDVDLADRSFDPAIAYDIGVVSAALTRIDSTAKAPIAFKTELRVGERGSVSSSGTVQQDFGQARAKLEVRDVALAPLRPLVARYARIDLKSGNLTAAAQLSYRPDADTAFTALGSAKVDGFLMNESATGERLLSWTTLSADSIELSLSPDRLAIAEARVLEPGMKIVIAEDRSVNLTQLIKRDVAGQRSSGREAAAEVSTSEPYEHASATFPVEIGRIRLEGGTMDFADLSLILPFATKVHALQGSVVGLSSAPDSRAELQLAGQIETYGEARAQGALMPWRPSEYLDIEAHFGNVRMPPLSPYSATFAGRKVAAGKLWLDLHYKIVEGGLAGENKIALQDFKLGERVEAPNALDLPLDLAIALLTDSKGRISLAVPVTGDLDSPKFDYGSVIRAAVAGAITRVVTAPFRMLAGLFGKRDAEEFRTVEFEPGSDRIAPAQREKLDNLAEALKQRPQLRLVVRGPYDAKRDAEELSRRLARRELARMVGTKLGPDEDPGAVAYDDKATRQALEKLLVERAGADALRAVADRLSKRTDRRARGADPPLNAEEDRGFYKAVFDRVVELQPQLDAAPRLLAAKRAQAIIDRLLKAGIAPNRLQAGGITQVAAADAPIASDFALDVIPGAS